MSSNVLTQFSNQLADAVAAVSASVVQVHGRRQPASGVVYAPDVIVTTTRAIGREDGLSVRTPDGRSATRNRTGRAEQPAPGSGAEKTPLYVPGV